MLAVLDPPAVFVVVLIVLAIVAAIAWPFTMSATGTLAKLQFEIPAGGRRPHRDRRTACRTEVLTDTQPIEQLDALLSKRQSLINVLQRRLDAANSTYARYLSTSQQVFEVFLLDNLHEVAVAYESISTIDETYIDRRLAELAVDDSDVDSATRER